jgi:glycosyltransferase involved in cell wall biosynthesis
MRAPSPIDGVRRVAFIAHSALSLVRFRGALMREVAARRHQVLALAPGIDDGARATLAAAGIQTSTFPLEAEGAGPFAERRTEKALADALRSFAPHLVVASGPRTAALGAMLGKEAGAGRVVLIVNGLSALGLAGNGVRGWLGDGAARRRRKSAIAAASVVVFHNAEDRRRLIEEGSLGDRHPHVVTAGSGIDLVHYAPSPLPPLADGLVFLKLARLEAAKGVLTFAEAAAQVRAKAPAAKSVLAGAATQAMAARNPGLRGDVVEVRSFASDVRPLIAEAHVVVHVPAAEGLAGALLEALSVGRPVIASDIPGCRPAVDERVNGCLVKPGDAVALAGAMESFLRRPDLIPAMARASRAKAERLFDERTVVAEMLRAMGIA